jgi:hypothetical protein
MDFDFGGNTKPIRLGSYVVDFSAGRFANVERGEKVNEILNFVIDAATTVHPKKPAGDHPTAGGLAGLALKVRNAGGSIRTALFKPRAANPASAELMAHQRPDGSFEKGYGPGGASPVPDPPEVLPMWLADP